MGAETRTYSVEAENDGELKEKYEGLVAEACYEHGHGGYTGTIAESQGLTITEQILSENEACDYIEEHAEKWENSLAIKIRDTNHTYLIGGVYSS